MLLVLALPARGDDIFFDFSQFPIDKQPPGFTNVLYGGGKPGEWKVVREEISPLDVLSATQPASLSKQPVLAQLSRNPTDERFPLLIYEKEVFGDFTLTTQFKIVDGLIEQLAGIVFRVQNETNFYVIRANAMDNTLKFYKVVNGLRTPMIGPKVDVPRGKWQELKITCKGNSIQAWLNGKEAISPITDNTFSKGRIGYWTKSDAISYFRDTKITYTPTQSVAQMLVRQALEKHSRLVGLRIAMPGDGGEAQVVASNDPEDIGAAASEQETVAMTRGTTYFGKDKSTVTVILPLRDRNGDPTAAVSVTMNSFAGQTQQNAIVRALPIVKEMELQASSLNDQIQ